MVRLLKMKRKRIKDVDEIGRPYWPKGYIQKFWDKGKSYGVATKRDMPIMASRGCPYRCSFCSNSQMWTTRYTLRSVDDVLDEIKGYIRDYNITALQFYDLTAIINRKWIIDFCDRLLTEKLI